MIPASRGTVRTSPTVITADETRYYHVVAALDQATAARITDIISRPPENDKCATIKKRLLQAYSLTEKERAERLLNIAGPGDRKPSQLMEEMLTLLGDQPVCFLFKQILLRQMPTLVRAQLSEDNFEEPRTVAPPLQPTASGEHSVRIRCRQWGMAALTVICSTRNSQTYLLS